MLRAKNVLIMGSIFVFSNALASEVRCTKSGVATAAERPVDQAYRILKWAFECKPSPSLRTRAGISDLIHKMSMANEVTNNGTYLPSGVGDLGITSEAYEEIRDSVRFPVFFLPTVGPNDYWKLPFEDQTTINRIAGSDCSLSTPTDYSTVAYCVAGCFAPDQSVLFFEEDQVNTYWKPIEAAYEKDRSVAAVAKGSSIGNVLYTPAAISYYLRDFAETTNAITHFFTKDGFDIKVTPNHPMVDGLGMVRRASSFKVGEDLVTYQGKPSAITSIQSEIHKGRVYNFDTEESEDHYKIIAANGLLSGTHWYQKLSRRMNQNAFQTIAHGSDFVEALESQGGL